MSWIARLFRRERLDRELDKELQFHLEAATADLIRGGMAPDEARRVARVQLGGLEQVKEDTRDMRGTAWITDWWSDTRYALRSIRHSPGYAIAVVLTLALGIGANLGVFTIVNAVLFRPLPYPESHRIVSISQAVEGEDGEVLDDTNIRALVAGGAPSLEAVSAGMNQSMVVNTPNGPQSIHGSAVTLQHFAVFGLRPLLGRAFTDEANPERAVVVLSEQMWRDVFAADSAAIGRSIEIDDNPQKIIGVMPAALTSASGPQFWLPLQVVQGPPGVTMFFSVVGRMRPGARMATVQAEVRTVLQRTRAGMSVKYLEQHRALDAVVMTLHDRRFGDSRRALTLLFATVGVLLLIACANLANLSLARAARREREFTVRLALGASRTRIVRHVLSESLLLSAAGAALGALLAAASVGYFVRISPGSVSSAEGVRVNAAALLFTLGVAAATGMLFGIVPALRAARGNVTLVGTPRATGGKAEQVMRRSLIVAQLATALVMLTGAALVTKTLARVTFIDAGFETDNLLVVRPMLVRARYPGTTAEVFYDELLTRLRREPGVRQAALVNAAPLGGSSRMETVDSAGRREFTDLVSSDTAYFQTIGARLVAGRWFNASDRKGAPEVAIINETMARERFPGRSALGGTFNADGRKLVVGVVRDIKQIGYEEPAAAAAYFPLAQSGVSPAQTVVVRTTPDIGGVAERVRAIVREIDPAQVPPTISTMHERMDRTIAPRRFTAILLGVFAGLSALLAVVGLYGVLSYLVAERTREIGIRVALGADAGRVLRFILGSGMTLTAIGVVLGAGAAAFTVRLLESLVYDMSVYDPWTFAGATALLVSVAAVASYVPARRAAAIDPVIALRAE